MLGFRSPDKFYTRGLSHQIFDSTNLQLRLSTLDNLYDCFWTYTTLASIDSRHYRGAISARDYRTTRWCLRCITMLNYVVNTTKHSGNHNKWKQTADDSKNKRTRNSKLTIWTCNHPCLHTNDISYCCANNAQSNLYTKHSSLTSTRKRTHFARKPLRKEGHTKAEHANADNQQSSHGECMPSSSR